MSTTYLATLLLLSLTTPPVQSWNLQNYGFPNHYYISSLAIFRQRAFLTLPRSSCFNANTTTPSLIELPWSGETTNKIPRTKVWLLNIKKQTWGVCRELQDAISVDVDAKKGRLWVLDRGNGYCDGKIVGFNLIFNYENGASLLNGVSNGDLAVLVVDPASHAQRIFVGGLEGEVIVFFTNTMKWQRVKLDGGLVLTDSLAVSRNKAALFITSTKSDDLFSLHLKDLETLLDKQEVWPLQKIFCNFHSASFQNATTISMNVTYHGQKMGPSGGVTADFKHGLIYYLKRDYAVVRWDTR